MKQGHNKYTKTLTRVSNKVHYLWSLDFAAKYPFKEKPSIKLCCSTVYDNSIGLKFYSNTRENNRTHVTNCSQNYNVGNQPNCHQKNEQSSTSQSRTVSLSLVPHLDTVQRLDVSFKPIVSTSKSRKYLKEYNCKIRLQFFQDIMFRKWLWYC